MLPSASIAPANTTEREYFIARIQAIKNVLSPISLTMMTAKLAVRPWMKSLLNQVGSEVVEEVGAILNLEESL